MHTNLRLFFFQEKYFAGLTSMIFGIVAIGAAMLALLLPDTSKAALPDDIADAEKIDSQQLEDQAAVVPHSVSVRVTQVKQ